MCDLLSAWISDDGERIACADLWSHARTQELLGWSRDEVQHWREWEWTYDEERWLIVRTSFDDKHAAAWYRACIVARWPTRNAAIQGCIDLFPESVTRLDCHGCAGLEELRVPESVTWLDCHGCVDLKELHVPESVTWLDCSDCVSLKELRVPESVTWLCCTYCASLTELHVPESVARLYCSGCSSLKNLRVPKSVIRLSCAGVPNVVREGSEPK